MRQWPEWTRRCPGGTFCATRRGEATVAEGEKESAPADVCCHGDTTGAG